MPGRPPSPRDAHVVTPTRLTRTGRPPLSTGGRVARVVLALSALAFVAWLVSLAAGVHRARTDQARPADAIVVLGAAQYAGRPSPVLRARLDKGIALYRRGLAPYLVVTGGMGLGDTTTEAAVGRRYAMKRGVPASAILLESVGRTTSESMVGVARVMRERELTRAILVSDGFHLLRLDIIARRHGLTAYTSPARTSPIAQNPSESWSYVLLESIKVPIALVQNEIR